MCLGYACAVQIVSGTDHMEHDMGAKIFRKCTQIHQESMTGTSPRKYIEQTVHVSKISEICIQSGLQMGGSIFAFSLLAPPVATLALQSISWCKKCSQRAPKIIWNSKSDSKRHSTDTKVCQKWCRILKQWASGTQNFINQHNPQSWPGGLREALWIYQIELMYWQSMHIALVTNRVNMRVRATTNKSIK